MHIISLSPVGTTEIKGLSFNRPYGTCMVFVSLIPRDESLGQYQISLWDREFFPISLGEAWKL